MAGVWAKSHMQITHRTVNHWLGISNLIELHYRIAVKDLLPWRHVDLGYDAGPVGTERLLHFHRFENAYLITRNQLVSWSHSY